MKPNVPTALTQIVLFASSFAPLLGLFAWLNTFGAGVPSLILGIIAGVAGLGLVAFVVVVQFLTTVEVSPSSIQPRDQDTIGYVVTYLLPFVTLGVQSWRERGAIIFFIVLVAVLYIRASLFYVNPLLALAGFRLYEAELETGRSVIIIVRPRYVRPGSTLQLKTVTESLYLEALSDSGGSP